MWNPSEMNNLCNNEQSIDDKILRMMMKMGYTSGLGLGTHGQGIVDPIQVSLKLDRMGFGVHLKEGRKWDFTDEIISVNEELEWLESTDYELEINYESLKTWMTMGPSKLFVDDETHFCDVAILKDILNAKAALDQFDDTDLLKARSKANPFETIKAAFFMNRAALKMANIDACTDFMFSSIDRNPHHRRTDGPYYFADVCAGPGGFSEYILWRKGWCFKAFGLTLKADNDFKVMDSNCASGATFNALYGANQDGNVCCPDNIADFAKKVLHETESEGVHFMMSDGGFSVDGNENLQEVLSKQLYICQCFVALEILRTHGHFVSKLFDIFTPFSVGLIFLMHLCFEKIAILKPNSSRPANSERYLICYGLKKSPEVIEIRKYFRKLVEDLWHLRDVDKNKDVDVMHIVPLDVIKSSEKFAKYITDRNNKLGAKQIISLLKLADFCRNPGLSEPRQEEIRVKSLLHWRIPDKQKITQTINTIDDLLAIAMHKSEFMLVQPREVTKLKDMEKFITDVQDWHFTPMGCGKSSNICNFYAATGGNRVYRLQRDKWVKVKNLRLARGTILYGEMVKETSVTDHFENAEKRSVHVIDALRLGDTSLVDLSFNERLSLIQTYCKALNFEPRKNGIRIRPKSVAALQSIVETCPMQYNISEEKYFSVLPNLGMESLKEYFIVNSILLMKTGENQSFNSTYVLRVQVFINEEKILDDGVTEYLGFDDFLGYLRMKI